jgi:hypothetical protein
MTDRLLELNPARAGRRAADGGRRACIAVLATAAALMCAAPAAIRAQTFVRDLDHPARQPVQAQVVNQVINEADVARTFRMVDVPLGQRLVVELLSLRIMVAPTPERRSVIHAHVQTQVNGLRVEHVLVLDKTRELPTDTAEVFEATQPLRLYADPGTSVSVIIVFHTGSRSDNVDTAIVNRVTLSGHFVAVNP